MAPPNSTQSAEISLDLLWKDFDLTAQQVDGDLKRFAPSPGRNARQSTRRAYVRAAGVAIEAYSGFFARYSLAAWDNMLSENEKLRLRKRRFILTQTGELREVRDYRDPSEFLWDAYDLYADTWGVKTPIRRESKGWAALREHVKVRNRITHPKSGSDLLVTDSELDCTSEAVRWLFQMSAQLFSDVAANATRRSKIYREVMKRRLEIEAIKGGALASIGTAPARSS